MMLDKLLHQLIHHQCRAPWPRRCGFAAPDNEGLAVLLIELIRDVARDFHMLLLIKPHGHTLES